MKPTMTRGARRTAITLAILFSALAMAAGAGCTSTTTLYARGVAEGGAGDDASPEGATDEGGPSVDGGDSPVRVPANICTSYIACVSTVSPPLLDGVIRAYGPGGSCFTAQSSEACNKSCMAGILMLGSQRTTADGWKNDGCNVCKTTEDCLHVGEVCASGACVAYAKSPNTSRDEMACDFGTGACGAGEFCSELRGSAQHPYGEGNCTAASPQGTSCNTNANEPRGFKCVDLSFSSSYGPGAQYLAPCRPGDCPASTTCLQNGTADDPLDYCVGPSKQP